MTEGKGVRRSVQEYKIAVFESAGTGEPRVEVMTELNELAKDRWEVFSVDRVNKWWVYHLRRHAWVTSLQEEPIQ